MSQQELLKKVVSILDDNAIDYMLTGSFVSSIQGEPRTTHDIDLLILLDKQKSKTLLQYFQHPEYYLNESDIDEALRTKRTFNLVETETGDKVDFWILTSDIFDISRFQRKKLEFVFGINIHISTPEDTILAKLKWAKESGGSEKQFNDSLRVYELQYRNLDLDYLTRWVKLLELDELFQDLQQKAKPYQ